MAKVDTSLTPDSVRKFLSGAEINKRKYCTKIQGFYVRQAAKKPVFGFRYRDATGKRRDITIGAVKGTRVVTAAQTAYGWRDDIIKGEADPFTKREQLAAEIDAQRSESADKQALKVGSYIDVYHRELEKKAGIPEARNTINSIKKHFQGFFDKPMDSLTREDVRAWEAKKKKEGLSRTSMQSYLAAFKTMLNFAAGTKKKHENESPVISHSPIANVFLSQKTKAEKDKEQVEQETLIQKRDLLSIEDRQKIEQGLERFADLIREQRRSSRKHGKKHLPDLDSIPYPHWFIPFCHVARLTGMRPGDIMSLRWNDIHTQLRTKAQVLSFTPNKTRHHENPIHVNFPLTGELKRILDAWKGQRGNPTTGLIFTSERGNGGSKLNRHSYKAHWAKTKELAEVDQSIEFYSFRHNFISDMVQRGIPVLTIAALVGHRDGSMIAKNYMRHDLDSLGDIVAAFGDSWTERGQQKQEAKA